MSCATTNVTSTALPRADQLTVDEKIGQLFAIDGYGVYLNETSWGWQRLDHFLREKHVGGFVWFTANVYEMAMHIKRLQAASRIPLLMSADMEAGIGMRLADTTFWPPAMAVAATGDPSFAERQGRATAIEARAVGINHILAPVADVNINPDNPVINARSYGEDPHDVARYVTAFIRGVQSEGVLTTAKHFPGHGDTHIDSHRAIATIDASRERLNAVELVPFKAAIDANVDSVMMGHLAVPALDPTTMEIRGDGLRENRYTGDHHNEAPEAAAIPATLSRAMIEDVLRKQLGFRGLVVTDAFDMGALTEHFDAGEAAVRAIEAGEDQILMPTNADAAIDGVKAAVASGRIPMSRIDASVQRILDAKSRVKKSVIDPDEIFRVVDSAESRKLANEIATKALTLVRDEGHAFPLTRDTRVLELVISDFAEAANPLGELDRDLRRRLANTPRVIMLDAHAHDDDIPPILDAAKNADVVLIALAIRARSGAGHLAIPDSAKRAIEQLATMNVKRIGIAFGSPYLLRELPSLPTYICAYGPQPVLQSAVNRALFGETKMTGRLPVTIPGLYERGFSLTH
jgi:beta-N-acetylhexosaminidase